MKSQYANNEITGSPGYVQQPGSETRVLADGSIRVTETYACLWARHIEIIGRYFRRNVSTHPNFPYLAVEEVAAKQQKPDKCIITVQFRGLDSSGDIGGDIGDTDSELATREWLTDPTDEPIETHPYFASRIGGTADNPKNGAIFDEDGLFVGFPPDSQFAGLKAYKANSPKIRSQYSTTIAPSRGILPRIESGLLLIRFDIVQKGAVYSVTKEWLEPGRKGWNTIVYG